MYLFLFVSGKLVSVLRTDRHSHLFLLVIFECLLYDLIISAILQTIWRWAFRLDVTYVCLSVYKHYLWRCMSFIPSSHPNFIRSNRPAAEIARISHSFLHCSYRKVSWICKLYIFFSNRGACVRVSTVCMPHDAVCNASQWWDFNVPHVTIMVTIQWVSVGLHVCSSGPKSPMGVRLEQRLILCSCNSAWVNEIWINNSKKAGRSIIWHFFDPP